MAQLERILRTAHQLKRNRPPSFQCLNLADASDYNPSYNTRVMNQERQLASIEKAYHPIWGTNPRALEPL